jgi:kynurenine formamidase
MPQSEPPSVDGVLKALGHVRSGRVFDLAVTNSSTAPRLPGQSPYFMAVYLTPEQTQRNLRQVGVEGDDIGFAIERVEMDLHTGTHVDALGHVAIDDTLYGGLSAREVVQLSGLTQLGSETIPTFVSRGVLLDVAALDAVEALPVGRAVTADDLRRSSGAAGVTLQAGDVALVHTGWLAAHYDDAAAYTQMGFPGLTVAAADYLIEQGVVAIGCDNGAVESPGLGGPPELFGVHQRCLTQAGVFLIENVRTQELAAAAVHEFVFFCASVKHAGGTAGPSRPIALV